MHALGLTSGARRWLLPAVLVAYVLAGKLGLAFATVHSSASAIWPATGIALAAVLLFGRRVWPAIFAGAFLVNVTTAGSAWTSLAIAGGNTLEGLVAAALIERYAGGLRCFDRTQSILKFALLALVATMISPAIGVSSLVLAGLAQGGQFFAIWITWWLGDAVGALTVTPLIVLWATPRTMPWVERRRIEMVVMLLTITAVSAVVFTGDRPLAFLCLPPLGWAAFRFSQRETASAVALLALIATLGTLAGMGPIAGPSMGESLLILQAGVGTVATMMLAIAALVVEHRTATLEAQAANRAKDEFLAMLSHELRNPLQGIASAVFLLEQERLPPEAGTQAKQIIKRQTAHLKRLVNDLLDVTRVVEGKTILSRQPVNLETAVRNCIAAAIAQGAAGDHQWETLTEPVWVSADPTRIEQVIQNLLANAIKYTPAGGSIQVSVRREDQSAVVRVRDTGIGIAADFLPRVFDLFSQAETGLERRRGGLGIGLTLVKQIAEMHDGRVTARSDGAGRGSEFTVQLPALAGPPAAAAPDAVRSAPAPDACRVLIVEDNEDARKSLRVLLEQLGHQVTEVADGVAAVERVLALRPEVALVDIGLPGLDGYEVARQLRARGASLRLVAVSGYGTADDVRHSREAGFDEHLVKPLELEDIQRVCRVAAARTLSS